MRHAARRACAGGLVLVAACAPTPDKVAEPEPLEVRAGQLHEYWRLDEAVLPMHGVRLPGPCRPGQVRVRYTISSAGFVSDVELLPPRPFDLFQERHIEQSVRNQSFRPAEGNEARQPVTVTESYSIDCPIGP